MGLCFTLQEKQLSFTENAFKYIRTRKKKTRCNYSFCIFELKMAFYGLHLFEAKFKSCFEYVLVF